MHVAKSIEEAPTHVELSADAQVLGQFAPAPAGRVAPKVGERLQIDEPPLKSRRIPQPIAQVGLVNMAGQRLQPLFQAVGWRLGSGCGTLARWHGGLLLCALLDGLGNT